MNTSLQSGYFASEWKTAILRPLLKKPNLELEDKNYRPVSNLPFISKITESAAMDVLVWHNDYNGTTPDHQSAYRKTTAVKQH